MRAIVTRSWLQTTLENQPYIYESLFDYSRFCKSCEPEIVLQIKKKQKNNFTFVKTRKYSNKLS
jgi:hypothetical protein